MHASGEIRIVFRDGLVTLKDDPTSGFKAFHHCGKPRDGARARNKTPMKLDIGKGSGNEFYASLTCPCLFTISFMLKPEITAAMIGERIIRGNAEISASPQKPRPNVELKDPFPPDSVREQIMRSYNI